MNIDSFHYMENLRKIILPLPGAEEYTCFGTPAFRVKKKLMARLKEDGITLAIHSEERKLWMRKNVEIFFITDHYKNYPMMLINLSLVKQADLKKLLKDVWRQIAPKKLLKEYEQNY